MKDSVKIALVKSLIDTLAPKSNYFTVVFIKADGSERVMNCQRGVKKHLAGGSSTISHKPNLISVYDVKEKGYRCFNALTVKEIRAGSSKITLD